MASIFRSIFASRPSIGNPHQRVKGHSYDSAIALDPPVKGSYPVAGNGPNLLEEIRRSRAQREISSARRQSSVAAAPTVPRSREDVIERPRTAPIDSNASGGNNRRSSKSINGSWAGRTRSGFSTKSPPSIFRSSSRKERRDSIRSTTEPPVPTLPTPSSTPKPQTYQPKKGPGPDSYAPTGFTPPFAQHLRNGSNASHKSHIDLLDAHSSIRPGSAKHRAKASGVRNYGEDVADRNIDRFGTPSSNPSQLDLSSPQFSYLKTVYAPKKKPSANVAGVGPRPGVHSRVSSALGHVLGDDKPSDDIPSRSHGKSPSIRSTSSTSRPHPLRTETATSPSPSPSVMSYTPSRRGRGRDEDRPSSSKALPSQDRRARALSPLSQSNPAQSIDAEPAMRNSVRKLVRPNQASVQAQARENVERELPPVAAAAAAPKSPPRDNNTPSSNSAVNHAVKRMSAMPVTNERPVHPPVSIKTNTNGHGKSKSGSVSYSTFPNTSNRPGNKTQTERTDFAVRPPTTSKTNKRQGMILESSSVPPNLDRVVDLSNTVDTEVTTKTIPAVTHEHVTPIRRQIREERIIREIHTHEVRHHVLPVIDTEILPPRHYIPSSDGKGLIEILEPEVPEHKLTGRMNGNWSLSKTPSSSRSRASSLAQSPAHHQMAPDEYESAEAPVIGLARGDPKPRSRATSRTSNHVVKHSRSLKNLFTEPILTSKKEYMAEEGYPRTEYTWRHPPVFEDVVGRTQPVCICAGLGDQNASTQQFLEDGLRTGEGNCARSPRVEEFLLFRDSGYGSHGMLPGLSALVPTTDNIYQDDEAIVGVMEDKLNFVDDTKIGKVNIASNGQREATQGLKRIQERRRKSSASKSTVSTERMANQPHLGDLVKGVKGLEV